MVRVVFLIFLATNILFADVVISKVKAFMGSSEYSKKRSLIGILFQNRGAYRINRNRADSVKIIRVLKQNGLIKLFLKSPRTLTVNFNATSSNGLMFIKVITDSLNSLGYNFFLTKKLQKKDKKLTWSITLNTAHILDPVLFAKALSKRGTKIVDISNSSIVNWSYTLNSAYSKLSGLKLDTDRYINLKKPLDDYFLDVKHTREIKITANNYDRWYPYIVFYDNNLKIIEHFNSEQRMKKFSIAIPKNTRYIKVSDNYTLDNIKRGLSIFLESY